MNLNSRGNGESDVEKVFFDDSEIQEKAEKTAKILTKAPSGRYTRSKIFLP